MLDDTDGISLRSVGGIFIGAITGLALAMIVFLFEVGVNILEVTSDWNQISPSDFISFQKWAQLKRVKNQVWQTIGFSSYAQHTQVEGNKPRLIFH